VVSTCQISPMRTPLLVLTYSSDFFINGICEVLIKLCCFHGNGHLPSTNHHAQLIASKPEPEMNSIVRSDNDVATSSLGRRPPGGRQITTPRPCKWPDRFYNWTTARVANWANVSAILVIEFQLRQAVCGRPWCNDIWKVLTAITIRKTGNSLFKS